MARVIFLCRISFLIAALTWPLKAQTHQINTRQESRAPADQVLRPSPEAAQVADQIGVTFLLERLRSEGAAGSPMTLETLALRQEITEKVLVASLDIDAVNAVIDSEVEQIRAIRSELQS